jgi:hypothetical protein
MPPVKPYNWNKVGEAAQHNYKFFEDCFDPNAATNKTFRDWFFDNGTSENDVRQKLKNTYHLDIPVTIKLVVVDLQWARCKNWSLTNPQTQDFYTFIMPPRPTRWPNDQWYVQSQQWEESWFHAIVDGYGM